MPDRVLHFASSKTANYLVAGIPAAARAVALLSDDASVRSVSIIAPGGFVPTPFCRREIERLAAGRIVWAAGTAPDMPPEGSLPDEALLTGDPGAGGGPADVIDRLDRLGWSIIAGTGKRADGIVSRYLNRPVSRAITRQWLKFENVRPVHATAIAAFVGIAMLLSLLAGGGAGLIAGGVLFQLASMIDGVDGEIARATAQESDAGARADSLCDAATNFAFLGGVSVNLWLGGDVFVAQVGLAGLAILAIGTVLLGRRAKQAGGPLTFDTVKHHVRGGRSPAMQWLVWLTMRDFYALAAAIAIVAGFAAPFLILFTFVAAGWLSYVVLVLWRTRRVA